jgi:hypothetical protein
MPSPRYYREQARVFTELASLTSDRAFAARLRNRAREYLAQARVPENAALRDLAPYLEEFNSQQVRKAWAGRNRRRA